MIILVSPPDDDHTAAIADLLRERGHAVELIDVDSVREQTSVELGFGRGGATSSIRIASRSGSTRVVDLATATTGWWRRLPAPTSSHSVVAAADGARVDSTASLESAVAVLPIAWVNEPARDRAARRRPRAWATASRSGLAMPRTLVTADHRAAHRFADARIAGGVVVKPLVPDTVDWVGARVPRSDDELEMMMGSISGEVIVQELVDGADVRVIVVDGRLFAVELDTHCLELPLDLALQWERGGARSIELPPRVGDAVRRLGDELHLVQFAVDLRRTADDDFVFLDLDPAAPWLLLEDLSGAPITEAVVDALAVRDAAALPLSGRSAALR